MEQRKLIASASPHLTAPYTTRGIMAAVMIALLPTLVASAFIFGPRVLLLTLVTMAASVAFEALYCKIMKKPIPVGDLSAAVTGMILAFNLPPSFPLWMAVIGAFIAVVVVKQLFGGIGCNFANPAVVGRIVLQVSFTGYMISYTFPKTFGGVDALATATPLDAIASATPGAAVATGGLPLVDLLLGTHGGVLGETCAITLILGGLFLIVTRVISPAIPAVYLGCTFVFKLLLELGGGTAFGMSAYNAFAYLLSGGLLLGAFFMATDYTTSPYTLKGKIIFGVGLAIMTVAMREWSNSNEGVSYAILFMNLLVPYINILSRTRPLGAPKKEKKEKEAA